MNREAADHRILKLRNEISNREFDRLYRELRDLQERSPSSVRSVSASASAP